MVKIIISPYIKTMSTTRFHAVLVAAGQSRRLGGDVAKPWIDLEGRMVISHALDGLCQHDAVISGVIVASPDMLEAAATLAHKIGWLAVAGGAERSHSVRAGLDALAALSPPPEAVLIHDAARPFIPGAVIDRVAEAIHAGHKAAIPVLPSADSLKRVEDGLVTGRIDRDVIARVQTPQAFDFAALVAEHRRNTDALITDDSTLMEDANHSVAAVTGDPILAKITTAEDLDHARIVARGRRKTDDAAMVETRTATGFDVHRFSTAPGPIRLGGIDIDHDNGFDAHSDGDVALHALTDAIYGLVADGDIGAHFPLLTMPGRARTVPTSLRQHVNACVKVGVASAFVTSPLSLKGRKSPRTVMPSGRPSPQSPSSISPEYRSKPPHPKGWASPAGVKGSPFRPRQRHNLPSMCNWRE